MTGPESLLARGVDRGIISAAQRDALVALAREEAVAGGSAPGQTDATEARPGEAPRALNAVSVAYYAGAAVVLFGFAWFLIERWEGLGAGGVLVVALVYALLFAASARVLAVRGYRTAAALATVLVVGMVPLVTWAMLSLVGVWPDRPPQVGAYAQRDPWEGVRWLPVELATILAALVALRRVRFSLLALPIAVGIWLACASLLAVVTVGEPFGSLREWLWLVVASLLLAIGDRVERQVGRVEDYAFWFHTVAVLATGMALVSTWGQLDGWRHVVPVLAVGAAAMALRLRRRSWLVAAASALVLYLGWLASEVFRDSAAFPVMLATLGLLVILGAVWAQGRFPVLTRGFDARTERARPLPGGSLIPVGLVVISLALLAAQVPVERERQRHQDRMQRVQARRAQRELREAQRRRAPGGGTADARAVPAKPLR